MKDLTFEDIKIGAKYTVKEEFVDECKGCRNIDFDYIVIKNIDYIDMKLSYNAYTKEGDYITYCTCYEPKHLVELAKTFETLEIGDKIANDWDGECEVLFANGRVIITENDDGDTTTYSKKEFEESDFTIQNETEPEEEIEAVKLLKSKGYEIVKKE